MINVIKEDIGVFISLYFHVLTISVVMITKTCGYGIRSVVYLATKLEENRNVSIQEIATVLDIPQHFLAKILQDLVRKKVVRSAKGPNGGFFIKKDVLQMPVVELLELIDGDKYRTRCFMGMEECSSENPCPLHQDFSVFRTGIIEKFTSRTINDLREGVAEGHSFLHYGLN